MKGKKKIFAAVLTFCLMLTGVPAVAFGEETAAAGDIVILYSSDIHGGVDSNLGLAGLAAYANEKRAQGSAVELVDAGDAVSGTMLAVLIPVTLQIGMIVLGINSFYQLIAIGFFLIIAVYMDYVRNMRPGK